MRRLPALLSLAASIATAVVVATGPQHSPAAAETADPTEVAGLTDGQTLVGFDSDDPADVTAIGRITGLDGDRALVGIDYRVSDRTVYGVGDRGGIYTLDLDMAAAKKVSQLTVALQGDAFGVDFNPAANRMRVVSDTGQNLRHNIDDPAGMPAAGQTATDTALTTPPATQPTTGVSAAAYTNNDTEPDTATTLFVLDTAKDQVAIQSPANTGALAATGQLGVDAEGPAGFDIHANTGHGLATLNVDGAQRLYDIDLLTGKATAIGAFPAGHQVTDIAAY